MLRILLSALANRLTKSSNWPNGHHTRETFRRDNLVLQLHIFSTVSALNLLDKFNKDISSISTKQISQISMDGPNINW